MLSLNTDAFNLFNNKFRFYLLLVLFFIVSNVDAITSSSHKKMVKLVPFQNLVTTGARSVEYFTIGKNKYLAVAQFGKDLPQGNVNRDGGDSDITSPIYQWNGKKFVMMQNLPSHGARDWQSFSIRNNDYLALANLRTGKGPYNSDTFSTIYQWDGIRFVPIQDILTQAAQEWCHFVIDGQTFLTVANYATQQGGKINFQINSDIYRWDGQKFILFQSIPTNGAFNITSFDIGSNHYLAYSNGFGNTSDVYIWKNNHFVLLQQIPSNKARDIDSFVIDGKYYLALANLGGDSVINQWNGNKFVSYQTIKGAGGRRFVFFSTKGHHYLVKINYLIGNKMVLKSDVYEWQDTKFKLITQFTTYGGTDATYFTIGNQNYLAVANANKSNTSFRVDSVIYKFIG